MTTFSKVTLPGGGIFMDASKLQKKKKKGKKEKENSNNNNKNKQTNKQTQNFHDSSWGNFYGLNKTPQLNQSKKVKCTKKYTQA